VITKKASVLEFLANLPNRSQLPPLASVKPGRVELALLDVGPVGSHLDQARCCLRLGPQTSWLRRVQALLGGQVKECAGTWDLPIHAVKYSLYRAAKTFSNTYI
jgi:hypothetical protein